MEMALALHWLRNNDKEKSVQVLCRQFFSLNTCDLRLVEAMGTEPADTAGGSYSIGAETFSLSDSIKGANTPDAGGSCLLASYSGGRDQEDLGSKPARVNNSQNPILKKTHHKKGLMEWLKVEALSSNPSTAKRKWCYDKA
jgi:hypothetical protein